MRIDKEESRWMEGVARINPRGIHTQMHQRERGRGIASTIYHGILSVLNLSASVDGHLSSRLLISQISSLSSLPWRTITPTHNDRSRFPSELEMPRSMLAAFDFDHTISNDNTDIVARKLLPDEKLPASVRDLYKSTGWIQYMSKIFELLHENAIDRKQIERAIVGIPAVPGVERLLRELHANGFEIIIISDSNTIFIEQWLKSNKLDSVVERVFTNPAHFDEKGMMRLDMYHVQDSCKLSTVNLCKGQILEDYIKERADEGRCFERIVYVGDGRNDLCPILRLSERDFAFPRKDYVLLKILNNKEKPDIPPVKAKVTPWSDGGQILRTLQEELSFPKKCI